MIFNKTKKLLVTEDAIVAKSVWRQALGLMCHKRANLIMYFKENTKISLHNFFVFYPLEIVVCNKEKQIIEINPKFNPCTLFTAKEKGHFCIELGKENAKGKCSVGDQLEF